VAASHQGCPARQASLPNIADSEVLNEGIGDAPHGRWLHTRHIWDAAHIWRLTISDDLISDVSVKADLASVMTPHLTAAASAVDPPNEYTYQTYRGFGLNQRIASQHLRWTPRTSILT
jgi:hypothetical protein